MAKSKNYSKNMLTIGGLAILLLVAASIFVLQTRSSSHTTPAPTAAPGDAAKSEQSLKTAPAVKPTTTPTNSSTTKGSGESTGSKSPMIESFTMQARGGGQFASIVLSSSAANGSCTISLTPNGGSAVTKSGTVVSSGSYLSCDFGGVIAVQGSGTAHLVVTAGGSSEGKDTTF